MPKYKLTYFNAKLRAEVARLMFAQAGVEYEDERFEMEEWPAIKPKMPFGEVPVLEIDGVQLAQSKAINRYLAMEFGFAGKGNLQQAFVEMYVCACDDLAKPLVEIYHCKDVKKEEELRKKFMDETVHKYLSKFEEALVLANTGFLIGDSVTWADLELYNTVPWIVKMFPPETMAPFPKVKDHIDRIESLPKIASWIANRPKTKH